MSRDIPLEDDPRWPQLAAWCRELLDLPADAELDADKVNQAVARARVLKDTSDVIDDAFDAVVRELDGEPDA